MKFSFVLAAVALAATASMPVANAQGTAGGSQFALAYPVVTPIFGPLDPISGLPPPITGYRIQADVIATSPLAMLPPGGFTSCSFAATTVAKGGAFITNMFNNTVFRSLAPGPEGTQPYKYITRITSTFTNMTAPSSLPPFIRADCMSGSGGGGPGGNTRTGIIALGYISPQMLTNSTISYTSNPGYATSYTPWGPFTVTGLDASPCNDNTQVFLLMGGIGCGLTNSLGQSISQPHCTNLIANPTSTLPSGQKVWDLYCISPTIAGRNLPVIVALMDNTLNITAVSSGPDQASVIVQPPVPLMQHIDLYLDPINAPAAYSRISASGSNQTIVANIPASPSATSIARVDFMISPPGLCPRVELKLNSSVVATWLFTANAMFSSICTMGMMGNVTITTLTPNANNQIMGTLTNFPSTGFGSGVSYDKLYALGFRLVVSDGIRIPGNPESYIGTNELAGATYWLARYAAPVVSAATAMYTTRQGPLGGIVYRINITATNLGPTGMSPYASRPNVWINGKACTEVMRVSDTSLRVTTPVGSGLNLPITVQVGDLSFTSSGLASYPMPSVQFVETVTMSEWQSAASIAAFAPIRLTVGGPGARRSRGSIVNVNTNTVVLLHGNSFGPWLGNGTLTRDVMNPLNNFWEFGSYSSTNNAAGQCISAPWAGRGSTAAAPVCNGIWDYAAEGELPSDGTILYWNDTMIAFLAPPAATGLREVVLTSGLNGATTFSTYSYYDPIAILRYNNPSITEFALASSPMVAGGSNGTSMPVIATTGDVIRLSGNAVTGIGSSVAPTYYTFPMAIPATRALLAAQPVIQYSHSVFAIGSTVASSTQCIMPTFASATSFVTTSGYLASANVPFACRPGGTGSSMSLSLTNTTANLTIPAGNGVNVPVYMVTYDAYPDVYNRTMVFAELSANAGPISAPMFSYESPSISGFTPSMFAITSNFGSTGTRMTISGLNIGSEDTAACMSAVGAPAMTLTVTFVPELASSQSPVGGYDLIPEPASGVVLPKFKGTGVSACSSVVNTYGFFPNLPVGRYGFLLNATSSLGSRNVERSVSQGVSVTCGAGYYGTPGLRCLSCAAFTSASCPGGNLTVGAEDLTAHVVAAAGFYNFEGEEEEACPPGVSSTQHPVNRSVCIAPCDVAAACTGNNQCGTGYTSEWPTYGCARCATGYARVNGTQCGGTAALSSSASTCVPASTCTGVGASVLSGAGAYGEDLCWCDGSGPAPSSSPSPSSIPPSPSPSVSPSADASPSSSPSVAAASSSPTTSPSGTRTSTPTPTPSPSVAPASCTDGVKNGAETDVDCGGSNNGCPRCTAGLVCAASTDCIGAAAGTASDAVCASSNGRCMDNRLGSAYWDGISTSGASYTGANTPILFTISLNVSVPAAALTSDGLETLRATLETVSLQQLERGGIASDTVRTVAALTKVDRVGFIGGAFNSSAGARRLVDSSASVVVLIDASVVVAPTASAPSTWASDVRGAVTRGAFSPASLFTPLSNALSSSSSTAWSSAASSNAISVEPTSTDGQALVSIVSVENAPKTSSEGGAGSIGVIAFLIGLVGVCSAFVMYSLRNNGQFMGRPMTPVATLFGMWPLSPKVKHNLRVRSAGAYGRRVKSRGITNLDGVSEGNVTNEITTTYSSENATSIPAFNNTSLTSPNRNYGVGVYTSPAVAAGRTSFAPAMTSVNPLSSAGYGPQVIITTATTPLAMYTSPKMAAKQASMRFQSAV